MSQALASLGCVVELTPAQADAAGRSGGFRVLGEAGTGKTTVLLHRYLDRVRTNRTGRVLVLCRNRIVAERFRRAAVRELAGGFNTLAITTIWALAFDIVVRHGRGADTPELLTTSERRRVLGHLLATEAGDAALWPTLHSFVGRSAFVEAADRGLSTLSSLAAITGDHPAAAATATITTDDRWAELAAFAHRFAAHCESLGTVDAASVVQRAAALLQQPAIAGEEGARFDEVLVDDAETATPAGRDLLRALGEVIPVVAAINPGGWTLQLGRPNDLQPELPGLVLDTPFRRPAAPELIECRHPSVETEAIAGELLAAHERGVDWTDMAVIASAGRIAAIARSTARHNIPAATELRYCIAADPLTRGIVDLVTWASGDESALSRLLSSPIAELDAAEARAAQRTARARGISVADLPQLAPLVEARAAVAKFVESDDVLGACHEAFRRSAAELVTMPGTASPPVGQRSLDAAVAFLDGLDRFLGAAGRARRAAVADVAVYADYIDTSDIEVDPWWGPDDDEQASDDQANVSPHPPGVTLTTVAGAADREWRFVVIAGCVAGSFPRLHRTTAFFEPSVLTGRESTDDRLRRVLDDERRRFAAACSRATETLLATSAPEPGVLVSRFVDGWPRRAATLPLDAPATAAGVPESEGAAAVWPSGSLRLSASQLDTYEDCPLKYAFRYAAGVRTEAGLHADLGTVTHDALAEFLDPANKLPCTQEALFQTADRRWRDDIAPYRPQIEEARRDYYAMLETWWEGEGQEIAAGTIEVLATEHPFEVEVGPHRITGRIDRVDRSANGTGIRVLDYKTGKSRPRPDDVAANIQLATYHLAACRDHELRAWGEPTELRLLYVRGMKRYDQTVADDHEAVTEARILDTADRIIAEEFDPSVDADCDHCEFHRLCPLWPEGLEVGDL